MNSGTSYQVLLSVLLTGVINCVINSGDDIFLLPKLLLFMSSDKIDKSKQNSAQIFQSIDYRLRTLTKYMHLSPPH